MGGGEGGTLRKRLGTPTSRIWLVSPVIVRLINWAATYDEVFIVLVMVVAKAILLFFFFKKKKKKKIIRKKKRFYQAGSVIKPHCCLTSRKQLVLTACVRPFSPGTAGLIPGSLSLSDDTIN